LKKLILVLAFLLISSNVFSQVEISSRLQEALNKAGQDDYLQVIVLLRSQVDLAALDQQLYTEKATLQQRAYQVITALQQNAERTQGELKNYFQSKYESADIYSFNSFWISNMFVIEAKPGVVYELMNRLDVAEIDLDALLELDRPVAGDDSFLENTESVEPGLKIINAHLLWAQGITGQGRLVMGIDTGVYPNHPALQHKWRGNHVPNNQAWFDPGGGSTTPSDCDGHGSHTMGTMTGWSPTTGDTVGVAPGAEWIAAKTICSSPHTSNSVAAFQWAMNPDGNPSTIDDMPDAISNSWYDPDVTNECSGIYKTTLDALEAAGIAVVFSAGNNGPGSSTVTKPKNINTNTVNVMSVGAIDGALYIGGNNNPIASFSSRGPSLCGGTGSLLIKPEVSAPGVNVRSSGSSSGYTVLSGTSMASPHVAGAVALLKQFAPNLTGKEILEALYNTAVDLGAAGEDNNYGTGLIDVYAAFLSLGTPDSTAPDPITDLTVIAPTSNSLTLQWTVPYDSSMNGVTGYDIRYSFSPINDTTAFNNATQLPFTAIPDTAGATENYLVEGLSFATTHHFAIKSKDVWGNWSLLSNSASGTTFGAPQISVTPASMHHVLNPAQTVVDTVTVSNVSVNPSTLDFEVSLENNTFPESSVSAYVFTEIKENTEKINNDKDNPIENGGASIDGHGGPDAFGYKWIDSDEPNGPQYVWEDISSTGTLVTNWIASGTFNPKDEGYAGPFPLGFNFKFYGNIKTQIYVSSNGLVLFAPVTSNIFTNAAIPNAAVPNEFIAPFWDDLDGVSSGTVHYKQDGNRFIVQFTGWHRYSNQGSLTFQVILYSSGKILVYYNNMTGTLNSATVGIENAAGTAGLQVAYNANYVANNKALQFSAEPEWLTNNTNSGTLFNGNSVKVVLTFKSEDFPVGNYSMDLKVASNDPVNPAVVVPVTMLITTEVPVELTGLTANADRNNVNLSWSTATETNNSGFQVERKTRGSSEWTNVSFVSGKGTTTEITNYNFIDKGLAVGSYSYRLKQVDLDGTFEYSPVIEVDVTTPDQYILYQNYPNPFNPATTIEYSLPEKAGVTISIYNTLGELVTTLVNGTMEAGYQKASFNASALTSGTYIYQIKAVGGGRTFVDTKKMILIK
jgi:bacillopeptidase F